MERLTLRISLHSDLAQFYARILMYSNSFSILYRKPFVSTVKLPFLSAIRFDLSWETYSDRD
jgi:hypothetical protein